MTGCEVLAVLVSVLAAIALVMVGLFWLADIERRVARDVKKAAERTSEEI